MPIGDGGTMVPMIMLCFLLAGTFVAGSVAASAAFLAQRDLAGVCDGAAVAAANAVDRSAVGSGGAAADSLPLSAASVLAAVGRYGRTQDAGVGAGDGTAFIAETDGTTVTVTCRRTVRIPFGALLGYGDGLDRTAVARARSPLG